MSNGMTKMKKKLEHWEIVSLLLMVYDFTAILVSYFAALWIRFDCKFGGIQKDYLYSGFCVFIRVSGVLQVMRS